MCWSVEKALTIAARCARRMWYLYRSDTRGRRLASPSSCHLHRLNIACPAWCELVAERDRVCASLRPKR